MPCECGIRRYLINYSGRVLDLEVLSSLAGKINNQLINFRH